MITSQIFENGGEKKNQATYLALQRAEKEL